MKLMRIIWASYAKLRRNKEIVKFNWLILQLSTGIITTIQTTYQNEMIIMILIYILSKGGCRREQQKTHKEIQFVSIKTRLNHRIRNNLLSRRLRILNWISVGLTVKVTQLY